MTKHFIALLLLCAYGICAQSQSTVSLKKLEKHVRYLADDKLKGRGTGTPEERVAAKYIAKQFKKLRLQPRGDEGTYYHAFSFKKSANPHGGENEGDPKLDGLNVAAFLDNGAPYTVVVGAHFDHLGLGHDRNSLDPNPVGKIHNGADDNASGTAGVLELARYFAKNGVKERHNFLFLCFSGEEHGLIGSKKYVESKHFDAAKVSYMVNMDMIGRLSEEKRLMVGGVGTSPAFVPAVKELSGGLTVRLDSVGAGPSDHTSFYVQNIPVLFAFTGQHADYHKPSDDTDKINFEGEKMVLDLMIRLIQRFDAEPKLAFQKADAKQDGGRTTFKVTLGVMPDYTYEGDGMRVDGVTDGRPAAKAGIQKGDVIYGLGEHEFKDVQGYMKALSTFKKGDTTKVRVKRGEEKKEMDVTF